MRQFFILIFVLNTIALSVWGSARNPYRYGTSASSPIPNAQVKLLAERLLITLQPDFNSAQYDVNYEIECLKDGLQIPILLYVEKEIGLYRIWVDDREVELIDLYQTWQKNEFFPTHLFKQYFDTITYHNKTPYINVQFDSVSIQSIALTDLRYFKMDLSQGVHKIRVQFQAEAWRDESDWVTEKEFKYAFLPLVFQHNKQQFDIKIDARQCHQKYMTNLGHPTYGKMDSIAIWQFQHLPVSYLSIKTDYTISKWAQILIAIDPFGIALIFGAVYMILHYIWLRWFRKNYTQYRFSPALIFGSLLVPALFCATFVWAYYWIDALIGPMASRNHGMSFLIFFFYPVIYPFYLFVFWMIDKTLKLKYQTLKN